MTDSAEQTLLLRARQGDANAFGTLVQRYQTAVFSVCWRLLGERTAAEDAAQEAFIRAYARLHTFDATRPFGPWLRRVAANLCFNRLQAMSPVLEEWNEETSRALSTDCDDPLQIVLRNERAAQVRAALLALPPHFRIVIELRHFQALNYEEIASELQLPLSSVKTHLFRARRLLADLLRPQGSDDEPIAY